MGARDSLDHKHSIQGTQSSRMAAESLLPCLWFDTEAEAAANHYVSIFANSSIGRITRFSAEGTEVHGKEAGSVMTVEFEINGQRFLALNGGPQFKFTEAVSYQVLCRSQAEVDYFWRRLSEGGEEGPCGWLKDKFGLSWQIVPAELPQMLQDHQSDRTRRVMRAMLQMRKPDIAALKRAQIG